jgi:hypothetical protein
MLSRTVCRFSHPLRTLTRTLPTFTRTIVSKPDFVERSSDPYDDKYEPPLVGAQEIEEKLQQSGMGGYRENPATGPFGTIDAPVLIFSAFDSRVVGCKGDGDLKHRLFWFQLKTGKKHVCTQCGQCFKLITPNNYEQNQQLIHKVVSWKSEKIKYILYIFIQ